MWACWCRDFWQADAGTLAVALRGCRRRRRRKCGRIHKKVQASPAQAPTAPSDPCRPARSPWLHFDWAVHRTPFTETRRAGQLRPTSIRLLRPSLDTELLPLPDRPPFSRRTHRKHGVTKAPVSQLAPRSAPRASRMPANPPVGVVEAHHPKQLLPGATLRHHSPPRLDPQGQGARHQFRSPAVGVLLHRRALQGLQR